MATEILSPRALGRATLARQMLLDRAERPAVEAVEHLVGLQAQTPNSPYYGLWSRLESFRPGDLAGPLLDRQVVRVVLMRSTIHLVSAADCLRLRPLVQPALERAFRGSPFARATSHLDRDALLAAGTALLDEQPRTTTELGRLLHERFPDADPASLHQAMRTLAPLVQVPPRGVWGAGGLVTLTTAQTWLGRPLAAEPDPEEAVLRYLAAYGPASVKDMQTWSGLTRMGEIFERLRPRLRTFRDERGVELFDLPDAPRPDGDTPAPPRFLPDYDNVLLGFADRSRFITGPDFNPFRSLNGQIPGTLLVDGFVAGTWRIERRKAAATLTITPYRPFTATETDDLTCEATNLLAFAADEAPTREVQVSPTRVTSNQ